MSEFDTMPTPPAPPKQGDESDLIRWRKEDMIYKENLSAYQEWQRSKRKHPELVDQYKRK